MEELAGEQASVEHAQGAFPIEEHGSALLATEGPPQPNRGAKCGRILRKTIWELHAQLGIAPRSAFGPTHLSKWTTHQVKTPIARGPNNATL